jgi:hypothetical protein
MNSRKREKSTSAPAESRKDSPVRWRDKTSRTQSRKRKDATLPADRGAREQQTTSQGSE